MTETTGDGTPAAPETPPHLVPKVPPPARSQDAGGAPDVERSSDGGEGGGGSRSGSGRRRRRGGRGRGGGAGGGGGGAGDGGEGRSRAGDGDRTAEDGGADTGGSSDTKRQGGNGGGGGRGQNQQQGGQGQGGQGQGGGRKRRRRGGRGRNRGSGGEGGGGQQRPEPVAATASFDDDPVELDEESLARRRGRSRKGRPVGRYLMCVHGHAESGLTQISVLEGRNLIEHYVSRPSDDVTEIHGNIYLGRVQNVLPGMEAAFVDIGTPKNAVLYRGDVSYDPDEVETAKGEKPRIEDMLKARQAILCQVTKNPIAHKGARLTTEVSLPGRFVVLVPNQADTFGISKRLPDPERKRLRSILEKVKPEGHGLIVRTAAEDVTAEEIERDVQRLGEQWRQIEQLASSTKAPALLYTEPDMAVRVIREEFNKDYRGIVIDDRELYDQVAGYMRAVTPALAERIEYYDTEAEGLPLFERYHVHEQVRKALDRKVWLPSGGSLIIEHTEALTVIDVNTGKNVGKSSLEETVFRNNLEAAEEIAKQLRLRDIGGIIVIDFVDMEETKHRKEVVKVFRDALARDKTRTQVYDVSDLGLVEMTRKRIGEGLLESMSSVCEHCAGRGVLLDATVLDR